MGPYDICSSTISFIIGKNGGLSLSINGDIYIYQPF